MKMHEITQIEVDRLNLTCQAGHYELTSQICIDYFTAIESERQDSMTYIQKRMEAYKSLEEQNDMKYWDSVNGTTTWINHINEVKTQFPKD